MVTVHIALNAEYLAHSQLLAASNSAWVRVMCPTLCIMYTLAHPGDLGMGQTAWVGIMCPTLCIIYTVAHPGDLGMEQTARHFVTECLDSSWLCGRLRSAPRRHARHIHLYGFSQVVEFIRHTWSSKSHIWSSTIVSFFSVFFSEFSAARCHDISGQVNDKFGFKGDQAPTDVFIVFYYYIFYIFKHVLKTEKTSHYTTN
jgi:hypothetical protein